MEENFSLPSHVGIIMDGNGRWATARGKKRTEGHKVGCDNVNRIASYAFDRGVKTLTLYAFSCENWARPQEEVNALMKLIKVFFETYINKVIKNKVKLNVMGDLSKLSPEIQQLVFKNEKKTEKFSDHILNIAINYGGRQEVVMAVNKLIKEQKEITVDSISENLYTASFGEPDLIIRTGGEIRISNFMLYQGAYSELYFCDTLWPDFNEEDFEKALQSYGHRKRRFGKI